MTVPGKGGRPRKWRCDADRVRAFRARERGEDEPPALEQALADGDELAHVLDKVRELQSELQDAGRTIVGLRKELAGARRELKAQEHRFSWIQAMNETLIAERARSRVDVTR